MINKTGDKKELNICERYDIFKNEWDFISSLKKARYISIACPYKDRYIYLLGGDFDYDAASTEIEIYDTLENEKGWISVFHIDAPYYDSVMSFSWIAMRQISENCLMIFGSGEKCKVSIKEDNSIFGIQLISSGLFPRNYNISTYMNKSKVIIGENEFGQHLILYDILKRTEQNISFGTIFEHTFKK